MTKYAIFSAIIGLVLFGCGDDEDPVSSSVVEGPKIVAMSPASGHSYMAMGQDYYVEFSEPMDRGSVEEAYQVMNESGRVSGEYIWNDEDTMMRFRPSDPMEVGMEMRVSWGDGMRSRGGQRMVSADGHRLESFDFRAIMYDVPNEFSSNGERIYFTATSASGESITFTMGEEFDDHMMPGYGMFDFDDMGFGDMDDDSMDGGTVGGGMMGGGMMGSGSMGLHGGMSCATCHGPDGRGGRYMAMGEIETPDIRYVVLIGEEVEAEDDHDDDGDDHSDDDDEHGHEPYTDDTIKQAITQGIEPDGAELEAFMPRWSMAEQDLDDLIEYLKSL